MEYSLIDEGDVKRVSFYGNIKPSSRPKFMEITGAMSSSDQKEWILDVHEFEYIDSSGLGMFIELHEIANQNGISVTLSGANGLVKRMFQLSRFETLFKITD